VKTGAWNKDDSRAGAAPRPATVVGKVDKGDRDAYIDSLLGGLTSLRGVTAAAIVDGDGFPIRLRHDFEIDSDALGVVVQIVLGSARQAAEKVQQGDTDLVLSENQKGLVLLAPLTKGLVLVVMTDKSAMLGAVRFELKETVPQVNALFEAKD